jgi:hypothetical protein
MPVLAPQPVAEPTEQVLRQRLGIPADAQRILVLGESSHWDPNWLHTSEVYYRRRIEPIVDQVMVELTAEPRRVFSVESLFFLQLYWQRRPEQREGLRTLLNTGRMRLTGTGITTPDTVLPDGEAILRDYLLGQEWLRGNGITVEPRLAYLPDGFGHTPALPSLLRALGMDMAAVTRIDGMHFVAADFRPAGDFPLPGSSASALQQQMRSADFHWRAPDGAQVLCHWNPFTYFQGDMLAHKGIIRWMGIVAGIPWRSARHVAARIDGFVAKLAKLAPTPYVFCPIGCDFVGPIRKLLPLLDRYNRQRYPETGVFVVNAGLDDYLALVGCHRARLPVVDFDPNPYWMGFYASRPEVKRICNHVVRVLTRAEKLSVLHPKPEMHRQDLMKAWDRIVLANHHDFITGTSPDATFHAEQKPWLEEAVLRAERALAGLLDGHRPPPARAATAPEWHLDDGVLRVGCEHYQVQLSEALGGCMDSLLLDGEEQLSGPANDLVAYRDSGGLWRLGHEFRGGHFREVESASRSYARIRAHERDGLLEVRIDSQLGGRNLSRWLWLRADEPVIRMRLVGAASSPLPITCRFPTHLHADHLTMDVPGGMLERPARKLYDPTFWPARSFAHARERERGLALFLGGPAAVSFDPPSGTFAMMAMRNAPRERAFAVLPLLCHPVGGTSPHAQTFDYGMCFTRTGDAIDNRLPGLARRVLDASWLNPRQPDPMALADQVVTVDRPNVLVTAVKPASRGEGVIVRLECFEAHGCQVRMRTLRPIIAARLCDARERDQTELTIDDGEVQVPVAGSITSVRLLLASDSRRCPRVTDPGTAR